MDPQGLRDYPARQFSLWCSVGTWFWSFPPGNAIGAAPTKALAIAEGQRAIAGFCARQRNSAACPTPLIWHSALETLAQYLAAA
jgi:hypothetical protein